jgi:flagellar biosynthesis component FlhA
MNWKIAFMIWLKGMSILAITLLIPPVGLIIMYVAIICSWVAIPIYACSLWMLQRVKLQTIPSLFLIMTVSTTSSVLAATRILEYMDTEFFNGYDGTAFWIPFACCIISVFFTRDSIAQYLYPEEAIAEYITE